MSDGEVLERILCVPRRRRPRCAALLGVFEDNTPVVLRLDVARHVLLALPLSVSAPFLRLMGLSLAVWNRQGHVQLVLLDPTGRALAPLAALPHVWGGLCVRREERRTVLEALGTVVDRRLREGFRYPHMVVLVVDDGGSLTDELLLLRLARHGAATGVHLVLAGEAIPATAIASFAPVQVASARDGFLLMGRDGAVRFRALTVPQRDIQRWVDCITGQSEPSAERRGRQGRHDFRLPQSVVVPPPKPWEWPARAAG